MNKSRAISKIITTIGCDNYQKQNFPFGIGISRNWRFFFPSFPCKIFHNPYSLPLAETGLTTGLAAVVITLYATLHTSILLLLPEVSAKQQFTKQFLKLLFLFLIPFFRPLSRLFRRLSSRLFPLILSILLALLLPSKFILPNCSASPSLGSGGININNKEITGGINERNWEEIGLGGILGAKSAGGKSLIISNSRLDKSYDFSYLIRLHWSRGLEFKELSLLNNNFHLNKAVTSFSLLKFKDFMGALISNGKLSIRDNKIFKHSAEVGSLSLIKTDSKTTYSLLDIFGLEMSGNNLKSRGGVIALLDNYSKRLSIGYPPIHIDTRFDHSVHRAPFVLSNNVLEFVDNEEHGDVSNEGDSVTNGGGSSAAHPAIMNIHRDADDNGSNAITGNRGVIGVKTSFSTLIKNNRGADLSINLKDVDFTANVADYLIYNEEARCSLFDGKIPNYNTEECGVLDMSKNIVKSVLKNLGQNSEISMTALRIRFTNNRITKSTFTDALGNGYGVLLQNEGTLTFDLRKGKEARFELDDNELINSRLGSGVIGILLGPNSRVSFSSTEGGSKFIFNNDIVDGGDGSSEVLFDMYSGSEIVLGLHRIECGTFNIRDGDKTKLKVSLGRGGLSGNIKGTKQLNSDSKFMLKGGIIDYGSLLVEIQLTDDFFDDGSEEEFIYPLITNFNGILIKEPQKQLKLVEKDMEWQRGIYKPLLLVKDDDYFIKLERLVYPQLKIIEEE